MKNLSPKYLQSYLLPQVLNQYSTSFAKKNLLTALPSRTLLFNNTFFLYCINKWNKLNGNLRNANSIYTFKNYWTKFKKVKGNPTFSISDPLGLKLLTRFCLNSSHLTEHDLRYKFKDPMCSCVATILPLLDKISSIEFLKLQIFDVNNKILNLTIQFLKVSTHFDNPLIWLKSAIWVLANVSYFFEFIII